MSDQDDKRRLDWLEWFINKHGAIMLHDGSKANFGESGLGLRPGNLVRTLREAIDEASGGVGGPMIGNKVERKKFNAFDEMDALARTYRHAVHRQVCECKVCKEFLRGVIVCEDLWAKEFERVAALENALRELWGIWEQQEYPQNASLVRAMSAIKPKIEVLLAREK